MDPMKINPIDLGLYIRCAIFRKGEYFTKGLNAQENIKKNYIKIMSAEPIHNINEYDLISSKIKNLILELKEYY